MLVLVAVAFLAAAETAAGAPAQAQAPAPAAKAKRICRVEEPTIGSLTPKRVCVTVPAEAPSAAKPGQGQASDKPQSSDRPESGSSN